jgi:L-threonylcarbamoyladenylate synthase
MSAADRFAGAGPFEVDVNAPDEDLIAEAGRRLRAGGIIAHPSDTVYGLAAAAHHPEALARLARLKGRPEERPFILLIDESGRVQQLAHSIPRYVIEWMSRIWPAPLTLILKGRPDVPGRAPDGSVALRCPAQPLTRKLVREAAGLLASTSANKTGEPVVAGAAAALALFGAGEGGLAMAVEGVAGQDSSTGGTAGSSLPSTIVDCREDAPRLVRVGAVPLAALGFD